MILKNIKKGAIEELLIDNHKYKVVGDTLGLHLINLHAIDGLVIQTEEAKVAKQILNALRSKNDPSIYLMPVYLKSNKLFKALGFEVDGYIHKEENRPLAIKFDESIRQRIECIVKVIENVEDLMEQRIIKALQYAYTRNRKLEPYRDRSSSIGYYLPFLSSIIGEKEGIAFMDKLDQLVKGNLLNAQLVGKVNCCNSCMGSYLNFHETCSKCASIDLKYENLIHHFRCAYIGPESDFGNGDLLTCPKCDKTLNHIGIDYDKPTEIASCKSCNHTSQETKMKASCIDCGAKNDLNQLNAVQIKSYELTNLGNEWICYEIDNETAKNENLANLRIVPLPIFNLLVAQERARSAMREVGASFLGEINVNENVYKDLNIDFRAQLKGEILGVLSNYLREIDILCAHHTGKYSFLLPDCKQTQAYELYLLVLDNLNKILTDNISPDKQIVTGDFQKI